MSLRQLIQKTLLAGLLALPYAVQAGDAPSPEIPKAKAKATEEYGCVAPVKYMRKNHMRELLHQRDETLREGVRTRKFSLAECINCHVTQDTKTGQMPKFGDDNHFCSSCHNYASVSVDCFSCHNDQPQQSEYLHSFSSDNNPHHGKIALKGETLSAETLQALTAGGAE